MSFLFHPGRRSSFSRIGEQLDKSNRLWPCRRSPLSGRFPSPVSLHLGKIRGTETWKSRLNSPVLPQKSARRSQRILLVISVLVRGVRLDGKPFSEKASTLVVNAHGASLRLLEPVATGQYLTLTNMKTNETSDCRVVGVMTGQSGDPEVGVEFAEPSPRFWRVSFPPEDWSPHNPEAKRREKSVRPGTPAAKPR